MSWNLSCQWKANSCHEGDPRVCRSLGPTQARPLPKRDKATAYDWTSALSVMLVARQPNHDDSFPFRMLMHDIQLDVHDTGFRHS
jgi:hypothetical protein